MDGLEVAAHWVPTPIMALVCWALMKRAFEGHEKRFESLATRFESTLLQMQHHDTALALLKDRVADNTEEIKRMRDNVHRAVNIASRALARTENNGEGGSGPRRPPT